MKDAYNIPDIVPLRGVAALGVVLFHLVNTTTDFVTDEGVRAIFQLGSLGVELFFLISGIVIPMFMIKVNYDHTMFGAFWIRRLARVEPSYVVAVVLGIAFWNLRDRLFGSELAPSFMTILLHLGYLVPLFENSNWIS